MTTGTVNFNKPEIEVPETADGSNYCSHNIFGRIRMTTNLDQSSKQETNFPKNDETSMEIILEEGREAAREHQAQDTANKFVFNLPMLTKTQTSFVKLNVKKTPAITAGEDALALFCVWEKLELAEGVL